MKKAIKSSVSFVLVISMLMSMFTLTLFASNAEARIGTTEYDTFAEAMTAANATAGTDTVEIELLKDITIAKKYTVSKNITISGKHTITRGDTYKGTFFAVSAGKTLTLKDVVIDGNNNWTFKSKEYYDAVASGARVPNSSEKYMTLEEGAPVANAAMFTVSGNVIMDGATVQNNAGASIFSLVKGSSLTMNKATVTHNYKDGSSVVADVAAGATLTINEGTVISNNHNGKGNATVAYARGTIVMNGGEIYGNTGIDCNGSVFMLYNSAASLTMNGGHIYSNAALYGTYNGWNCVIYVYGNGTTFTLNDGVIENNYATWAPGVVSNGANANITVNGGKILNNESTSGKYGPDLYVLSTPVINKDTAISGSHFYKDINNYATITGDVWIDGYYEYYKGQLYYGPNVYTGEGTIIGHVTVYNGSEAQFMNGTWNGRVTVNAVGTDSTLTVYPDATIIGGPVRVLCSVESADSENAEEAKVAQDEAYVEQDGATVDCPVLYYHRLASAQQEGVVVTFDYNGGLDAQNWSGIQITSAEGFDTLPLPAPTIDGYVLVGWKYAEDNDPETLSMKGTDWYEGEAISQSVRLVAQWAIASYELDYGYTGDVPEGAPALPESSTLMAGDTVDVADEPYMDNYLFSGWETSALIDGKMPYSDVTLTGSWTPIAPTEVIFSGTKFFNGMRGEGFEFALKDANGNIIETVKSNKNGEYAFSAIEFAKVGTHKYTVVEIAGGDKTVIYDDRVYSITVTVERVGDELSATVSVKKDGLPYNGDEDDLDFRNYRVGSATLTIEGKKRLDGKLAEGFIFALVDKDGNVVAEAVSGSNGHFSFDVIFYEAGEYSFKVVEINDGQENIVYDESEYEITVTVELKNRKLKADYEVVGTKNNNIEFNNTTKVEETEEIPEESVPETDAPETTEPAPETTEPAPETTEPAPETTEPAPETTEPAPETTEPAPETTEPAPETTEPAPETTEPAPETTEPAPETTEPAPETTEPAPETTEPAPETTEPAPETTEPAPETTEPAPETTEPAPETTEPAPETTEPAPETSEPETDNITDPEVPETDVVNPDTGDDSIFVILLALICVISLAAVVTNGKKNAED